jgi:hypothetical protein
MGEEAEAVLTSSNVTDEHRAVYEQLIGYFDGFLKV